MNPRPDWYSFDGNYEFYSTETGYTVKRRGELVGDSIGGFEEALNLMLKDKEQR